ncbi:MAG: 3,4-dihydroxy-2-butanone-4-phosphate synthase, partial [Acidobacteriales bacterium]|nr:3,4-dihydroxy-2-butanone-4-phosphate synthase [Terriglobales bacterium]
MPASIDFADIETAIAEIRNGRMIVVVDDEDRENEGDLTIAAEFATPDVINFMSKFGRGLICLALTEERADHLRLGPMTARNTSAYGTAFTESIEAREGVTTGISAADRARTIQVAIAPTSKPTDLVRPGHMFPLRARKGGVLVRAGQTEAAVDLARLAGLVPAGVICEIMNDDGSMARVPDLVRFCQEHSLKMVTVADLIRYRMAHERYVHRVAEAMVPTPFGEFRMVAYESELGGEGETHVALIKGEISHQNDPVLVRMHSHCLLGDVFGASFCDCKSTVERSLAAIAREGRGALIYLHSTSKGFEIDRSATHPELRFHHEVRPETSSPESQRRTQRQVGIGAQILN